MYQMLCLKVLITSQIIRHTHTGTFTRHLFSGLSISPIFTIGQTVNNSQRLLLEEIKEHKDVLEMSMDEDYLRISFKIIGGFLWIDQ